MLSKIRQAIGAVLDKRREAEVMKANLRSYLSSLRHMLSDQDLNPHESQALSQMQRSLSLEPAQVHEIHLEVLAELAIRVIEDNVVTASELALLPRVAAQLGVSLQQLPPQVLSYLHVAWNVIEIQKGNLPLIAPGQSRLLATNGETIHLETLASIWEERTTRTYIAGSSGVGIRIAKGVSYRVGGVRGRTVSTTALVPVDEGSLVVSSKRFAFIGVRQTFNAPWGKLLSAEPLADGIQLALSNRKKPILAQYRDPQVSEIVAAIVSHYVA